MVKIQMYVCRTVLPALALTGAVMLAVLPVGCRTSVDGVQFLSGDFSVPQLEAVSVVDEETVRLEFSRAMTVAAATISTDGEELPFSCSYEGDSTVVTFALEEKTQVGLAYTLSAQIEDSFGNTLSVSVPFLGFNGHVPLVALSEVRNAYGDVTVDKVKIKKGEFVELLALTDGNLSGLELVSAGDGEKKKYEFPAVEVTRGEYITVHLRKIASYTGMEDDEADDLTVSTATDSCPTALDLWAENEKARLADSDILIVRNAATGDVLDALPYAKTATAAWAAAYADIAAAVERSGVWQDASGAASCARESAVNSDYITSTVNRSFSRQNCSELLTLTADGVPQGALPNSAENWLVTVKRKETKKVPGDDGVTPGYANSSNAYVPAK